MFSDITDGLITILNSLETLPPDALSIAVSLKLLLSIFEEQDMNMN